MSKKQKRTCCNNREDLRQRALAIISTLRDQLEDVLSIHAPRIDAPSMFAAGPISLRCTVCHTPEHHTWAAKNHELWPCPTVRAFLNTSETARVAALTAELQRRDEAAQADADATGDELDDAIKEAMAES